MSEDQFDYDVAFSFHSKDEALATQLNDLLQDRFETFLYSRRQEELAGADGEEKFNTVFSKQARCVVVFYRAEWGETPFTRIEQTAIRNRAFHEGYEFTIFIPTEQPATVPPWVPRTRLYFGMDRHGLQGAAGAVETRIQELGGEPRVESVAQRATRLQRANEFSDARKQFREQGNGSMFARLAFTKLIESLTATVEQVASSHPSLANIKVEKLDDRHVVYGAGPSLVIQWRAGYYRLDNSVLLAELYKGVPPLPGFIAIDEPEALESVRFDYDLFPDRSHGYVARSAEKRQFSPNALAEHLLRFYMDATERLMRR